MISCSKCSKAFTFAEIREVDIPLEELGCREAVRRGVSNISENLIKDWANAMTEALEPFQVGDIIVYLDGQYWNINAKNIKFEGYYAAHEFDQLPHAEALDSSEKLMEILGKIDYWTARELSDREL